MRKLILLFFVSGLFFNLGTLQSQDIHFAHIHASPTFLNPALTGLFDNGSYRFIANARSQWETVTNGYKTVALSADGQIGSLGGKSLLGGGLELSTDRAGDLNFSKNSASLSLSVLKSLNPKQENYIALGLRSTYQNYRLDYSKMIGFDSEPLVEHGAPNNLGFLDISAGLAWYYSFKDQSTLYVGAGVFHINTPSVSFYEKILDTKDYNTQPQEELYRKIIIHGGAYWRMGKQVTALPSFMFLDQGPHQEVNAGSFLRFARGKSFTRSNYAFYAGAWFRWHIEEDVVGMDAVIASIRMDINKTAYTFSFDANVSTLKRASSGFGGPEISIIKIIGPDLSKRKSSKVKCPAF